MRVNTAMKALLVGALMASACSADGTETVADGDASTATIEASEDQTGGQQIELGSSEEPETVMVDGEQPGSTMTEAESETEGSESASEDNKDDGKAAEKDDDGSKDDKSDSTTAQKEQDSSGANRSGSDGTGDGSNASGTGSAATGSGSDSGNGSGSSGGTTATTAATNNNSGGNNSGGNDDSSGSGSNSNNSSSDTTAAPATTAPPATTAAPQTTAAPSAAPAPAPAPGNLTLVFNEDFTDGGWQSRIDTGLFHRDDHVIAQTQWAADHVITGPNDLCGPPTEKRTLARGDRESGFNNDWIYRCVPGGDLNKAHLMTSIGDTSGYSLGGFAPKGSFNNVREVRWDVNQTDLGDRQWTEVAVVPADRFNIMRLPCTLDVPCDTVTHDVLGSVGTQWAGQRARRIQTPDMPGGYMQAIGGYRCDGCAYAPSMTFGVAYGAGDPALTSLPIRRQNYFRDNGNGTLTWGFQLDNGSFNEFTVPGSFPSGPVRVVFKDHNYTPLKSPATLLSETTFTWHWDNIQVYTG